MAKPLIKWVGGKRQMMEIIKSNLPANFNAYYEPFFGGGAVFFDLAPEKAVINDANSQLANLYLQAKLQNRYLAQQLTTLEEEYNSLPDMSAKDAYYYQKREEFNQCIKASEMSVKSASLLIFLNKAGFNGLYRINQKGFYNVPSAHRPRLNLFDEGNLAGVKQSLQNTAILNGDFEEAVNTAVKGDFVFFDPPYYDVFDNYQAGGFTKSDQVRLFEQFKALTKQGVYCMTTNNSCNFIRDLYHDYRIQTVAVKRMVNRNADGRSGEEVLITNY